MKTKTGSPSSSNLPARLSSGPRTATAGPASLPASRGAMPSFAAGRSRLARTVGAVLALAAAGQAQTLFGVAQGALLRIDATTAAITEVGRHGLPWLGGLEAHGGRLYAISWGENGALYSLDPRTAAATMIGSLGVGRVYEGGFAIDSVGTGYFVQGNGHLFRVDLSTGVASSIGGVVAGYGPPDIVGMTSRSDGMLVALDRANRILLTIDPTTARARVLVQHLPLLFGVSPGYGGMTGSGTRGFLCAGLSLYSFDLFTGNLAMVGGLGVWESWIAGLAQCPSGTFTQYGQGCPGSGRAVPSHHGSGTPDIGQRTAWHVSHNQPFTFGMLYIGQRQAPLGLHFLGMGTCTIDVNIAVYLPLLFAGDGVATVAFTVPDNPDLLRRVLATQAAVYDPGTSTPTRVVHSNGLETRIGDC